MHSWSCLISTVLCAPQVAWLQCSSVLRSTPVHILASCLEGAHRSMLWKISIPLNNRKYGHLQLVEVQSCRLPSWQTVAQLDMCSPGEGVYRAMTTLWCRQYFLLPGSCCSCGSSKRSCAIQTWLSTCLHPCSNKQASHCIADVIAHMATYCLKEAWLVSYNHWMIRHTSHHMSTNTKTKHSLQG